MDNDFATGYALGSDSGNGNNSGFGGWGDGLWAIIILAMIWGGNGWGGFGGGSNSPGFQGYATRADVNEAIALMALSVVFLTSSRVFVIQPMR